MTPSLVVCALIAGLLVLAWAWRPRNAPGAAARVLLIAYVPLGAWALWFELFAAPGAEPEALQHYKPSIVYWAMASILLLAPRLGWGYPVKIVVGTYFAFSDTEWRWINLGIAALCAFLGGLNLFIALNYSPDDWEGFKWASMVNVVAVVLLRLNFLWFDTLVRIAVLVYQRAKALRQRP
jgi:intracellular septation protein